MKTIKKTGPLLISVNTDKTKGVPKGKVQVTFVRYEAYEYDVDEFNEQRFEIHDASLPEAKLIAKAVLG